MTDDFRKMAEHMYLDTLCGPDEWIDSCVKMLKTTASRHEQIGWENGKKEGRKEIENELMCELRDPCGTIWEHAKRLQDDNDRLKAANEHWHTRVEQMTAQTEQLTLDNDNALELVKDIHDGNYHDDIEIRTRMEKFLEDAK